MNGLSSGTFAKTATFAQPIPFSVLWASSERIWPKREITFMFMPASVEAMLKKEQILFVFESAFGRASIIAASALVVPFCTSAPNPPRKSMSACWAALSRLWATFTAASQGSAVGSSSIETGVTLMRRFVIGTP